MKLFQIYENDLAELEHILPQLQDKLMLNMDNQTRVQLRRIRQIVSDVRWNYGPPTEVEIIE